MVREYVGPEGSPLAELAAQMDEEDRQRREEETRTLKAERERLAASVEELCEAAEILARAALVAAGYHQHKRGEWRKRRESEEES